MMRALIPAILVMIAFFVCSRLSPHFADATYLLNSSTLYMEMGLIALGMTLVIISGNIDLSVGSILVLTACLTAKLLAAGVSTVASMEIISCRLRKARAQPAGGV